MKTYLTVPAPRGFDLGKKGNLDDAFREFNELINYYAQQGWDYHSMENLQVTQKPGCMQQQITTNYYMLIFERDAR